MTHFIPHSNSSWKLSLIMRLKAIHYCCYNGFIVSIWLLIEHYGTLNGRWEIKAFTNGGSEIYRKRNRGKGSISKVRAKATKYSMVFKVKYIRELMALAVVIMMRQKIWNLTRMNQPVDSEYSLLRHSMRYEHQIWNPP